MLAISAQGCGETSRTSEQQAKELSLNERQRVLRQLMDVLRQGLIEWDF